MSREWHFCGKGGWLDVGPVCDRTRGECRLSGLAHANGPVGDWTYPQACLLHWMECETEGFS